MPKRNPKVLILAGLVIFVMSIVDAIAVYYYLRNPTFAIISCLAGISIAARVLSKGYARLKAETIDKPL